MSPIPQPQDTPEPDGLAEATVITSPDEKSTTGSPEQDPATVKVDRESATLSLPERYASDLFPTMVVLAIVATPAVTLGLATTAMPWWTVFIIALFMPSMAFATFVLHRFYWVPPEQPKV